MEAAQSIGRSMPPFPFTGMTGRGISVTGSETLRRVGKPGSGGAAGWDRWLGVGSVPGTEAEELFFCWGGWGLQEGILLRGSERTVWEVEEVFADGPDALP